jgi:hypothetical protein
MRRDQSLPDRGHFYRAVESKFFDMLTFSVLISSLMEASHISSSVDILTLAF